MNFIFPYIGLLIIPIDEVIFFRGVGILAHQPARFCRCNMLKPRNILDNLRHLWYLKWIGSKDSNARGLNMGPDVRPSKFAVGFSGFASAKSVGLLMC